MLQVELVFKKNLPEGSIEKLLDYLEARLAAKSFIEGENFSVADVAVTSYLMFFKVFLPQVWPRLPSEQCFFAQLPQALEVLSFASRGATQHHGIGLVPLSETRHMISHTFISL